MIELGIFLKSANLSTAVTMRLDSAFIFTIATIAYRLLLK
jgi:hypothetical protein